MMSPLASPAASIAVAYAGSDKLSWVLELLLLLVDIPSALILFIIVIYRSYGSIDLINLYDKNLFIKT